MSPRSVTDVSTTARDSQADQTPFDAWCSALDEWNDAVDMEDVGFYRRLAEGASPPVVELGIGSGRVAAEIRPGVGVDNSPVSLDACRRRLGADVTLLCADLADYRLEIPAGLAYAPLNTFNHVVDAEHRVRALANAREQTAPGGLCAFDVAAPDRGKLRRRDRQPVLRAHTSELVMSDITEVVDEADGQVRIHGIVERLDPDGSVTSRRYLPPLPFAYLDPERVEREVGQAGWEVVDVWGGFRGEPLEAGSRQSVWLLRRPA